MEADLFENLFIFEIANNHQGDLQHGLKLVRALGEVARRENLKAAVKFQFRHLDTFLSSQHRAHPTPLASRFLSTKLETTEFSRLLEAVRAEGLLSMCTPFDETSAAQVKAMGFDFVKVASCSATDGPLLREIADLGIPIVASSAGLTLPQIDDLVSRLRRGTAPLALMHCVALYPSENHELRLGRIAELRTRFPDLRIGFSTHERPENLTAVQMAYAMGARLFEKHVGLPTENIRLNSYSASPAQLVAWIQAWKSARSACADELTTECVEREARSLRELKRACVAARPISKGAPIRSGDILFSLTQSPDQLLVENFREGMPANRAYEPDDPISASASVAPLLGRLKSFLREAEFDFAESLPVEISHHYGLANFSENGAFIICPHEDPLKKFLVLLPGQSHPLHFHHEKNETFRVLRGSLRLEVDGNCIQLGEGEEFFIPKGSWHRFSSLSGAVVEERTDATGEDSQYEDTRIQELARHERKTIVPFA